MRRTAIWFARCGSRAPSPEELFARPCAAAAELLAPRSGQAGFRGTSRDACATPRARAPCATMPPRAPGKHALIFVATTVLIDVIGFGFIIPVLPSLLVQLTGTSVSHAAVYGGWLSFVFAIMQFVCAPILGNLSDRFGRRPV